MSYRKSVLICTLLLIVSSTASAQQFGFNIFNERNHPHLEWVSAETEHFIISYPKHLEGIEAEVAAVAEETYAKLSANLNVTFDYKIRINVSDEDEIVNGFAVPFPESFTNIWVNLNDYGLYWTGPEKWLRTVVAHELAHIFHFQAVRSNIRLIGMLGIGPSMPVPWTEGIAQYYTEPWHATRGDALLRTAFYDGRPSYTDGTSPRNGSLMYAVGNAQLRYFTTIHGDSTVAKILAHRDSVLFNRVHWHNFRNAFKEVTDQSFREFEDEWRRHMSIYYHTLAGQMERSDSLGVKPLSLPGYFVSGVSYSPDTTRYIVVGNDSRLRPVTRIWSVDNDSTRKRTVLHEGGMIMPYTSWHPDGNRIAFSEMARGENGSLINDVYTLTVPDGNRERITHSRRASRPIWSADGESLIYIVSEGAPANLMMLNLETRQESRITSYTGDVQIGTMALSPDGIHLAYSLFDADGARYLVIRNLENGEHRIHTRPELDDRNPIWSPDGSRLMYTSLRDYVPNLFVINPFEDYPVEERVTALFTGGMGFQWLPADSTHEAGTILITSTDTKTNSSWYRIDASRRATEPDVQVNPSYTTWLTKQPDHALPVQIPADPSLIIERYDYNSWRNISHIMTLPFPYFSNEDDFGVGGISLFGEPLGKHTFVFAGAVSFTRPADNSLLLASYTNRQFEPIWSLNAYHNSFTARIYESDLLVTTNSGAFVLGTLPRDWIDSPFVRTNLFSRLRYEFTDAKRFWEPETPGALPLPDGGWQSDVQVGIRMHKQKPHAHALIHPLDGRGFEFRTTVATKALGGVTEFVRPDLRAYTLLPGGGNNRFYVYGRAVAQWGDSFPQDYIGFSRFDEPQFAGSLEGVDILYADVERVRGFNDYVAGDRLVFGSVEYRMPFLNSLNTNILGIVSLGRTTLSLFADGGMVWSDSITPDSNAEIRAGTGAELKNVISIGAFSFVHSLGFAQPVQDFTTSRNQEIYYRVRAVIPF